MPPAADVEGATEPKPLPPVNIATDAQANAQYSADVESWGERVRAAGVRVCEWLNDAVKTADYECRDSRMPGHPLTLIGHPSVRQSRFKSGE